MDHTQSTAECRWQAGSVLLPVQLLLSRPGVLSACGVLSATTETLEPLLPLLLRVLSSGSAPGPLTGFVFRRPGWLAMLGASRFSFEEAATLACAAVTA